MKFKRNYRILFYLVRLIVAWLYPIRVKGRDNVPPGAAIVCANHTSLLDPVLMAYAFTLQHYLHFMAKLELFQIWPLGSVLRAIGSFPVSREKTDISALRTSIALLKKDEKVMMFPEGTRVQEDESVAAKAGAIRLAGKYRVPIIPVFVDRRKKPFRRTKIVIGEPYMIPADQHGSDKLAAELMEKIFALGETVIEKAY